MSRRKHSRNKGQNAEEASKFRLETLSFDEKNRPELKAAMLEAARGSIADYPKVLELIKDQLRRHDPIGIMASFASYGLMTTIGSQDGSPSRKPLEGILQHHAELLQAIILTLAPEEWGRYPLVPGAMQVMFDNLPKLADTFFLRRILNAEKVSDQQELTVLSLQERIRMHTMGVRNWAHFSAVVQVSKELYSTLDPAFHDHYGFSCSDFISVMHSAVGELERRQAEHWKRFRRVMRGKNPRQIFTLYFKNVPGLVGTAEDMLAALPGIDLEGAIAAVISHYDLRLSECGTFKPDDIACRSGHSTQVVERVLRAVSLAPGQLSTTNDEHLFLGNPVWEAPVIDLDDTFFLPMPQAVFSHIHRIMERLAAAAGLKEAVERARSKYLQSKLETAFKSAVPGANINPEAKWKVGDQVFETDLLLVIDRTVVIAEAKASRLTPEGLRGAPARVKRHIEEMVLAPSVQSERLAAVIEKAQQGDSASIATVTGLGIDPEAVDRVVRLSITLDDLSVLSAAEADFKKVGWVPLDHELAPTILLADLLCIIDILGNPLLLLHYLTERAYFQKAHKLLGDELDFLGLYLENGFNFVLPNNDMLFVPSGMSGPIDRYYDASDAGLVRSKPKPKLSALFWEIINRLNERRPKGWTTVGIHLLGSANLSEQKRIEKSLEKLRKMVRKNYRDPSHVSSVFIQPPQQHKARVGFHIFAEQRRSTVKATMEQLSNEALEGGGAEAIVLFARGADKWDMPYEAVLYAKNR